MVSILLILALSQGAAYAKDHHYHHRSYHHVHSITHDGRPSAWCGWQMHQWYPSAGNGHPGINLNMARDWAKVGTGTVPGVGAIVVWPHHVGLITGYDSKAKMWIVKSGNDGHRIRERPRSVAGAIAFRSP